jgi:hypothetical protein
MPFNIGSVLSPQIQAALIRRGETKGQGGFVQQHAQRPTRRDARDDALARLREQRLAEQSERQEARNLRQEDFQREGFEFQKTEAEKAREERGEGRELQGRKLTLGERKQVQDARRQGTTILARMGSILKGARKKGPLGEVDPVAVQEARTLAAALWQQYMALPIPEADKQAAMLEMRKLLPSAPASRAPGISRSGQSNATPKGNGPLDSQALSEISSPPRTP